MARACPAASTLRRAAGCDGSGYVVVGDVKRVDVSGDVDDPNKTIGAGNIAVLKAASTFKLPDGECSVAVATGDFPLTLVADGGKAALQRLHHRQRLAADRGRAERPARWRSPARPATPTEGTTTLARGVLKLNKPASAIAIPGNLMLGGSAAGEQGRRRDLGRRRPDRSVRGRDAARQSAFVPGPERPQGRARQGRAVQGRA